MQSFHRCEQMHTHTEQKHITHRSTYQDKETRKDHKHMIVTPNIAADDPLLQLDKRRRPANSLQETCNHHCNQSTRRNHLHDLFQQCPAMLTETNRPRFNACGIAPSRALVRVRLHAACQLQWRTGVVRLLQTFFKT